MKLYCFYLCKESIDTNEYPAVLSDLIKSVNNMEVALYAYTPDKEVAKYFRDTRDMTIFIERTLDIDKDDYEDFCDTHGYKQLLEIHIFSTKIVKDGIYDKNTVKLLCTQAESDEILYNSDYHLYSFIDMISPDETINFMLMREIKYKKDIEEALSLLMYDSLIRLTYPSEIDNFEGNAIDDIGLFIKLFGNTFNNKEGN